MNLILIFLFIKICLLNASNRNEQSCKRPSEYILELIWLPTYFLEEIRDYRIFKNNFAYLGRVMAKRLHEEYNDPTLYDAIVPFLLDNFKINSFFSNSINCPHKARFNENLIKLRTRQDLRMNWPLINGTFEDNYLELEVDFWKREYEKNCPCTKYNRFIIGQQSYFDFSLYEIDRFNYNLDVRRLETMVDKNGLLDEFAFIHNQDPNINYDKLFSNLGYEGNHTNPETFFSLIHEQTHNYNEFQTILSRFSSPEFGYKVQIICSDYYDNINRLSYIKFVQICYDRNLKIKNCNPNGNYNCPPNIKLPLYFSEVGVSAPNKDHIELKRMGRRILDSSDED